MKINITCGQRALRQCFFTIQHAAQRAGQRVRQRAGQHALYHMHYVNVSQSSVLASPQSSMHNASVLGLSQRDHW